MKRNEILKYRSVWLGIAMLWTIWYHSGIHSSFSLLSNIKQVGYGGVDIFLFASGVGCYFSLDKNQNIGSFVKRRFLRLGPTYFCFMLIWVIYKIIMAHIPAQAILGNLLGIQDLTGRGNGFNWYISALVILYLLAPYFKICADKVSNGWKQGFVILFLLLCSVPFWNVNLYMIIVTRLPVFYVGMLFARFCKKDGDLSGKTVLILSLISVIGMVLLWLSYHFFRDYLWAYGLHWYPFLLIVPGLCMLISYVFHGISKWRMGRFTASVLAVIGDYSFEIYLVHVMVFEIFKYLINTLKAIDNSLLIWGAAILCTGIGSVGLRGVTNLLCKRK